MEENGKEEHDLLVRIAERTHNIWRVLEQLEKQVRKQNGAIQGAIKECNKNTTNIKWIRIIGGFMMTMMIVGITKLLELW